MHVSVNPVAIVLATMLIVAVYTDIVWGKIYNKLTIPCIIIGLIANIAQSGWAGAQFSLMGAAFGFGVFVVIALTRVMSGGDAKLLWAVGALEGWLFLAWTLLFMALAGGLLALAFLIYRKMAKATLSDMGSRTFARVVLGAPIELMPTFRAGKLPYSVAIAAGAAVALFR